MPGLDGAAFVAKMIEAGFSGSVIVHSSPLEARQKLRYSRSGVHTFLEKVCQVGTLVRTVESACRASTARSAAGVGVLL